MTRANRRRRKQPLRAPNATLARTGSTLPVLASQLRESLVDLETSVNHICDGFDGMARRARETVARPQGGANAPNATDLLVTSRATVAELLDRISRSTEIAGRAAARIEQVERGMGVIASTMAGIDEIVAGTQVLAVNAKIEAVRAGGQGRGFRIVAEEISKLAQRSSSISEAVSGVVTQLSNELVNMVEELRHLSLEDAREVERVKERAEHTLQELSNAHGAVEMSLRDAASRSDALAGEIASSVQTLQFQDRVNQRIMHVVSALERLASECPVAPDATPAEWLIANYSMESERNTFAKTNGSTVLAAEPEASSVELF